MEENFSVFSLVSCFALQETLMNTLDSKRWYSSWASKDMEQNGVAGIG